MKKVFKIKKIYTDSTYSDSSGFENVLYWRFQNPWMFILTLGWHRFSRNFKNVEEIFQTIKEHK